MITYKTKSGFKVSQATPKPFLVDGIRGRSPQIFFPLEDLFGVLL